MLYIQRIEVGDSRVTLVLQGIIAAEWADLLERECSAASPSGAPLVLDRSGVVFIGRSGFEALMRLSRAGIGIVGQTPLIADALEDEGITANRPSGDADDATDD